MPTLQPLRLIITGTDRVSRTLGKIEGRIGKFGRSLTRVGRAGTLAITAPAIGAGALAARASAGFDDELLKARSLVGLTEQELAAVRPALLDISKETGRLPVELAKAFFTIASAGQRGQAAIDLLRDSAKATAAGLGETEVVADASTSAINAYGAENLSSAKATGVLIAAVREGKAEASSFAPVLGRVIPIASALGVRYEEVAAAIASMTKLGTDADESTTSLRAILVSILNPASQSDKALGGIGLSAKGLRLQLREEGLLSVLQTLQERFEGNEAALTKVFPNVRALTGFLNLMGKNADEVQGIFESLARAGVGTLNEAFGIVSTGPGLKFARLLATSSVALIRIGDQVLPVVLPLVERMTSLIERGANAFARLNPETKRNVVIGTALAAVIPPILVGLGLVVQGLAALKIGTLLVGAFSILSGPVGIAIAAVATLVTLGHELAKRWKPARDVFEGIVEALRRIGRAAQNLAGSAFGALGRAFGFGGPAIPSVFKPGSVPRPLSLGSAAASTIGALAVSRAQSALAQSRVPAAEQNLRARLDIRIDSDGRPRTQRLQTNDPRFDIGVNNGLAMAGP